MAELNIAKVSAVTSLIGWHDVTDSKLARITRQSKEICALLGLDRRQFELLAVLPSDGGCLHRWIGFGGQMLRASMIDFHQPKYCPLCLEAAPYRRRRWDLSLYTECHVHGVSMLDACPSCGARLAWSKALAAACGRCGKDLADAKTSSAPAGALKMAAEIACAAPATERELAAWSADPNSPKLAEICELITFTGGWKLLGKNAVKILTPMSLLNRRRLLEATHSLVHSDQDVARTEFFSALMRRPAKGGSAKMREIFPKFYAALYSQGAPPGLQPLRGRFENFVRHESGLDLAAIGQRHNVAKKMPDAYVGVSTASQRTGIPYRKLMAMIAAHEVPLREMQWRGGTITLIARERLREIADMLKNGKKFDPRIPWSESLRTDGRGYVTSHQFSERWGLSKQVAGDCLKHGVVPGIRRGRNWTVGAKANAEFEHNLKTSVIRRDGFRSVSAKQAMLSLRRVGFSAAELFRRILDGEIRLAAIDETKRGLDKFSIYEDDVASARRMRSQAQQGTLIDLPEAAARLVTTRDYVRVLCRQGIITPQTKAGPGRRILVESSDVQKFAETYICTTAIWRKVGRKVPARKLAQLGIYPVVKVKSALYFRRQDVEAILGNPPIHMLQGEGPGCTVRKSALQKNTPDAHATP